MNQPVNQFIGKVKGRLNQFRFFDSMIWAGVICAGLLAMVCLTYILRGYAVPKLCFVVAGVGFVVAGLLVWVFRLWSRERSAEFADRYFDLKDSLATSLTFDQEQRSGDFVTLQGKSTANLIENIQPKTIQYQTPKRLIALACVLIGACALMAFKQASPVIIERQLVAEETHTKTEEINEHLEELIEELEKTATDEEKELLKPDQLKEWVKELNQSKDRKEAMRQYALLERKLKEAANRIDQRKNEQLLAKAGGEVQKDAENRALGRKMESKQFRQAAEELEKLMPKAPKAEKMSEQRKELARLKSASQRMAAAAKASNRKSRSSSEQGKAKSSSANNQSNSQQASNSKSSEKMQSANGSNSKSRDLSAEMAALEGAVSKYDQSLQNAELQARQMGKCDSKCMSECKNCRNGVLSELDKLKQSMCKTACQSECHSKLLSMCRSLGQCQNYLNQKKFSSLSQCMGSGSGGKKAGQGSVESRRSEMDFLTDNGNTTQLKGQKGSGTSQSIVESADEGSGVSSRRTKSRKLEFARQMESFVQREDVPEDVKQGVKVYFENIHQSAETTNQ